MTPPRAHHRSKITTVVTISMAIALVVLSACAPTSNQGGGSTTLPNDVNLMTDTQVSQALADVAPKVLADFANPKVLAAIPPDKLRYVTDFMDKLKTADGRASLVSFMRGEAKARTHGGVVRPETVNFANLGLSAGFFDGVSVTPTATGTRIPPPSGSGTHTAGGSPIGANVPVTASSAPCRAPGGVGTVVAPATTAAGQLLTPGHDVFTKTSTTEVVGAAGPLSVTGVDPVSGGGPGIEFRTSGLAQQMHVRIDLEDPKGFGPLALYPLIDIKPIGGDATSEYRATVSDGQIYCYQGDTRTNRGYFDGWVTIPRSQPGFQLIDEVVENDYYFRCDLGAPHCDFTLAPAGPQYWAGADRATIHAGAPALSAPSVLPASVGAFVNATPDDSSGPSVLSDTNGNPGDDVEAAIRGLLDQKIRTSVNGALAGDLFNPLDLDLIYASAQLTKPIDDTMDVSFLNSQRGFSEGGEPASGVGGIHLDLTVVADVDLNVGLVGFECDNLATTATLTVHANAWADSAGASTGFDPKVDYSNLDASTDVHPEALQYVNPICDIESLASGFQIGDAILGHEVTSALDDAFKGDDNGPGSVQKLLQNLDLNAYLPEIPIGSATIKPIVPNIDNAWCRTADAPQPCTNDQDLFAQNGLSAVADATMVSSLGQSLGGAFEGKFRNVYAPTTYSSVAELTTAHTDLNQQTAGLGVVLDPRLVNELLRDLSQGDSTTTTSNGLLDVANYALPIGGWNLSTSPTVAPEVLGGPDPSVIIGNCGIGCAQAAASPTPPSRLTLPIVEPDVGLSMTVGPNTGAPVKFSVAASINAGVQSDPARPFELHPSLDTGQLDILITGGCKVNYQTGYATAYSFCGRGGAGTGGNDSAGKPISLTDAVSYVANNILLPLATKSIGNIQLPSLDSVLPGFPYSLTNVRFNQRGGFLAVYGEVRETPRIGIAVSTEKDGDTTFLRFFPTNASGIDLTVPGTSFVWTVKDHTTGQTVATIQYPGEPSARETDINNFVTTDTNFGPGKVADATLTVKQSDREATASTSFTWNPPSFPPPNTCVPGPGGGHFALPAAAPAAAPIGPGNGGAPGC